MKKPSDPWATDAAYRRLKADGFNMIEVRAWLIKNPPVEDWLGSMWEFAEVEMPISYDDDGKPHPRKSFLNALLDFFN